MLQGIFEVLARKGSKWLILIVLLLMNKYILDHYYYLM